MEERGYRVLEMNYFSKTGEIDIIAKEGGVLCFCEVKYRKSGNYGLPIEAVSLEKQQKITATAYVYLMSNNLPEETPVRFDVISVLGDEIVILKNAFEATM